MSEGELEKRIRKHLGEGTNDDAIEDILNVLDEAKAKAPHFLKFAEWYSDDDVQEARKWFKKYLGDV